MSPSTPAARPPPAPAARASWEQDLARAAVECAGLEVAVVVALESSGSRLALRGRWPPSDGPDGVDDPERAIARAACDAGPEEPGTADPGALGPLASGRADARALLVAPLGSGPPGDGMALVGLGATGDPAGADGRTTFARLARLTAGIQEEERRGAELARARMARLVEAGMALAGELSLAELLEALVETARELLDARYAALGVVGEKGATMDPFVAAGISDEQRRAIGHPPLGRGLLGVVIRDGRPVRLARIADDPRAVGFPPGHPPMDGFLGVPIQLRGEVFGNLYLTEKRGGPFTEEDEQLAQTLAAQAAVAVDNARRYERERRRVAELESVQEVAQAVLGTLDLDDLLPLVARRARRLTDADTAAVALLDAGGLVVRYADGAGADALPGLRAPAEADALARRLQAVLGAEAAEVAPLELEGELAGVLVVVGAGDRFDEGARRIMATFSSQAAIALANARAFAAERERLLTSAVVQAAQARERAAAEGLRRAIRAQEAERARVARELHDEAGQVLTALALHLRGLEEYVSDEEGRERLAELRRSVNVASAGLRELAIELRPSGLREHGLANALERQVARLRESGGIAVDLALGPLPELPEEVEVALFRVVQESLTNVARHSGARHASVVAAERAGRIRIVVEDDGRGFDPAAPTERLGIAGIRERVQLLGGSMRIESAPGAGTAVFVDLELPR